MDDTLTMPLDAFVRTIAINRGTAHSLLIGAGASITSGMPSAERCLMEWKVQIFGTANPGLEKQIGIPYLPAVQRKIQIWLDKQQHFPKAGAEDEYGRYFEYCYPVVDDRRAYFEAIIKKAHPSYGYRLLVLLAESGLFNSVWTTNFDGLTARAASGSALVAIEVGLDSTERIRRQIRRDELMCVAMHGDYRYDALKNTPFELQTQDGLLRNEFCNQLEDQSLVVLGYSGRDDSLIETLMHGLGRRGKGRFYWCGYQKAKPDHKLGKLIEIARNAGRQAFYVDTNGFDDTMRRIALQSLDGVLNERANAILTSEEAVAENSNTHFSLPIADTVALVKTNCFPVACPSEVYQLDVPSLKRKGAWAGLREIIGPASIVAGLVAQKVVAIGSLNEIKSVFGNLIEGSIDRVPIADHELELQNGVIAGMLRQALVRCLSECFSLGCDNDSLLWDKAPYERQETYRWKCAAYRAVIVGLKRMHGRQYLTLVPTVFGKTEIGKDLPEFVEKELKRKILSVQYNDVFNKTVEYWRKKLFADHPEPFEFPANSASSFKFAVEKFPTFGEVSTYAKTPSIQVPEKFASLMHFRGIIFPEPKVVFTAKDGVSSVASGHPIRGLLDNRPYDYSLTTTGLDSNVRFGVVCPKAEAPKLRQFLAKLNQQTRANSKLGYLQDYPGFAEAFGLPFSIPEQINPAWITCPEPVGNTRRDKAVALVQDVRSCIKGMAGGTSTRLVLVFIPSRWSEFADYSTDEESINLHDLTKAYCVQRGIASQFLREKTFEKRFNCEVMWWLALSMYAKSMRTPWILEGLSKTTAFVGLGFGMRRGENNNNVVLGCSHIYNSDGIGLNYRVSKIENPIFFQKNPHLSNGDAINIGEGIRQLFFESSGQLPQRVVVHKRTPFLNAERDGLLKGLKGVSNVDLLEINIDPSIRCTASVITDSGFAADDKPVTRGTVLLLDEYRFLLWVNGNAHPTSAEENYYMGRFRIPSPLMIKKHWGSSNLEHLASEILALSKMNWNTFDLHTSLPATIHSSNEIAKIGKLLNRFERESFDYRLFI